MYEEWYTIKEAVACTGLSESTFQRMIRRREIQREYRPVPGRKDVIVLDPDRIRALTTQPRHPVPTQDSTALVAKPSILSAPDLTALIAVLRAPPIPLADKLLLTTAEAARFSGLSTDELRAAAHDHRLPHLGQKPYKFRPADLRRYIDRRLDGVNPVNGVGEKVSEENEARV